MAEKNTPAQKSAAVVQNKITTNDLAMCNTMDRALARDTLQLLEYLGAANPIGTHKADGVKGKGSTVFEIDYKEAKKKFGMFMDLVSKIPGRTEESIAFYPVTPTS
jgi:hypothetical protein